MWFSVRAISLAIASVMLIDGPARPALGQNEVDEASATVQKSEEKLVTAFNAGKVDELKAIFLPKGELIDEEGTVYQGTQEIEGVLVAFFEKFPGAKLALNIESVRMAGPVAIEEGPIAVSESAVRIEQPGAYLSA